MSRSQESINTLIRDGNNLKLKIGMLTRQIGNDRHNEPFSGHSQLNASPGQPSTNTHIRFLVALPEGIERSITEIFSLVCNFRKIDHAGIYMFNRTGQMLNLVCHFNLPDEILARVVTFNSETWQFNMACSGQPDYNCLDQAPLHARLSYEQLGIREVAVIPLAYHGQVVGCLNLATQQDALITGFEQVVLEGLALRISRAVALFLAQEKLVNSNRALQHLMSGLHAGLQPMARPASTGSLTDFFTGIREDIHHLGRAISGATGDIIKKLLEGQQKRELPFHQKKVDAILDEIDVLHRFICRLRLFCTSQAATIERGMMLRKTSPDMDFLDSLADFNHALELLVADEKKHHDRPGAFVAGKFRPVSGPDLLANLNTKIDRLNPN